ncbi:MAG: hypothetical protein ABEK16_00080 [Candidatus Nanohalobium sp.]
MLLVQETDWKAPACPDGADDVGAYVPKKGAQIMQSGSLLEDNEIKEKTEVENNGAILCEDEKDATHARKHTFAGWMKFEATNSGCNTDQDEFNSCSPVHENDVYRPEGEIIVAREPEKPDVMSNYKFYICRKRATIQNKAGEWTGKVVKAKSNLYKCNPGTGEWDKTSECNDEIDNDGDGQIDYSYSGAPDDTDCDSKNDMESSCTPVIQERTDSTGNPTYYALYSGGADDAGYCTGGANGNFEQAYADWKNSFGGTFPKPDVLRCNSNTPEAAYNLTDNTWYEAPKNSEGVSVCSSNARDYYMHDEIPGDGFKTVYVAKYYPETPYMKNVVGSILMPESTAVYPSNSKTPSKFVNSNGWTAAYMGLDGHSGFGQDSIFPPGAERQYAKKQSDGSLLNRHSPNYWFDYMGMRDPDSDNIYRGEQNMSWEVANAGSDAGGEINQSEKFPGGWYGRCKGASNDWAPESDVPGGWRCSNASISSQTIKVNMYSINSTGGKYVGFQINGSQLQKWKDVYGVSPVSSNPDIYPLTVRAQCWEGKLHKRPSDLSKVVNLSVQASGSVGNPSTMYVIGKLPDRPNTVVNPDSYSCIWGFQQQITDRDDKTTAMTGDVYVNTGTDTSGTVEDGIVDSTPWSSTEVGFVISGTQSRPVKTSVSVIESPGQSTLSNRASSSYTSGADPWWQFPGPASTAARHPSYAYCQKYGGC